MVRPFLSLTKGGHIWWTLYTSSITHGFWRHESALLIHPYLHTITRTEKMISQPKKKKKTVKMINLSNDAVHYLGLGQLLCILVFSLTWDGSVGPILHERGSILPTHNNLLLYFDIDFGKVQKKFVKIYIRKFWKITQSFKLSSIYLPIVVFVFVRRNLSRSLRDLKSIAVFIEFFLL